MRPAETFALALGSLRVNRARTFLSALGIVIGVASVITMISVGSSAQLQITSSISDLGSNLIMISPTKPQSAEVGRERTLTMSLAERIKEACPALRDVSPVSQIPATIAFRGATTDAMAMGVSRSYLPLSNLHIARGRGFTASEESSAANVAVLSGKAASKLFGEDDPVGRMISMITPVRRTQCLVVGVTESKADMFTSNASEDVYVPVTSLVYRMSPVRRVAYYIANTRSAKDADAAVAQVSRFLDSVDETRDGFTIMSQEALLDVVRQATSTMTLLLGAIAGISLLVGGIGIMSTMLTSVAERTREIGVRKSLGAKNRDILAQFLAEAVALAVSGGVIGMLIGWLGGAAISAALGWASSFSLTSVVAAVGFSSAVGLAFGIFPAMRAARMEPVAALRYE
ncbi:MAG: ABC transporter permease [Clostridia bacterium]|nr:ABC transporter permease [Clostridia bacterium]